MVILPENNKFIVSRMNFELAAAIKQANNNQLHIDDALIVAATPAVLLNYKAIEDRDLKRIMVPLKRFFKRNPRFLDFTKEAVAEGLRREWLDTLENDDKATLLSDFKLTPAVTEDGYVVYNPEILANLTKTEHPDREIYGRNPYTPKVSKSKSAGRPKVLLTDVAPDANLSEKLKPYIDWYKANWAELHPLEAYKWRAVKHFQTYFDIEAEDIAANLKESFRKEGNLLSGPMYMPLNMLVKNAKYSPDDVRMALINLYDESKSLSDRVAEFLADFATIHQKNVAIGNLRQNERDMQSERAVSVYLAFRYPEKHYLYKSSVWTDFKDEVGLEYPSLTHFPSKLYGYERIADHIREILKSDEELMGLLTASEKDDISAGHLLTQDLMYCISYHMHAMAK